MEVTLLHRQRSSLDHLRCGPSSLSIPNICLLHGRFSLHWTVNPGVTLVVRNKLDSSMLNAKLWQSNAVYNPCGLASQLKNQFTCH